MAVIKCKTCGETNLIKQGNVFVCQSCGTLYSLEDVIAMNSEEMAAKVDRVETAAATVTDAPESVVTESEAVVAEPVAEEVKAVAESTAEEVKTDTAEPATPEKCSARKLGCLGKLAIIAGVIFLVCLLTDHK